MSKFELLSFDDDSSLAKKAAEEFVREVVAASGKSERYCVALSGGRIAKTFSSATAELLQNSGGDLAHVHFFWGDERCVPPTDPESNFAIARDRIFVPLKISERQIHRIRGEDSPDMAAAEAQKELLQIATVNPAGQPRLDLVLLGTGEDGHVASLFPGESEATMADKAVFRAVTAAKPPPKRITLGYAALAAAGKVWVLASGAGKEAALRESLSAAGRTPLARVIDSRTQTRIFSDIRL